MRKLFDLLKKTFSEWSEHKAQRLSAALAYYTIFSISPLLLVVIAIVGLWFGQQKAQSQIIGQVQGLVGPQGAQIIQTMLQNAYHPGTNIIATIIGLITLLLGALGVFGVLQDSLNTIWEVAPNPKRGIGGMIRDRFMSFTLLLGTGFLLLVSLVLSAGLQAVGTFFGNVLPFPLPVLEIANNVFSFLVITLLFAMIYKYLPDAEIRWSDVWIGAAVTSLLFVVGKFAIGFYLGRSSVSSTYGAAGALVIVLLWVYYSGLILFFGAEFTRVYADQAGSRVRPSANAIPASNPSEAQPGTAMTTTAAQQQYERGISHPEPGKQAAEPAPGQLPRPQAPHALPEPRAESRALAKRPASELAYRRNLAALFGFLAGAILEARVLKRSDCEDGNHQLHNGNHDPR